MGRILQGSSKTVQTGDATGATEVTIVPKATQETFSGSKLSYKEKPVDAIHDLELPDWVKRECSCLSGPCESVLTCLQDTTAPPTKFPIASTSFCIA